MKISEFYKYSWFADLAYVEWNDNNGVEDEAIKAAVDAKRTPQKLAEKIFKGDFIISYGWAKP